MPQPMSMIVDPEFRKVVQRFRYSSPAIVARSMNLVIRRAQQEAIKEARNQLKLLVYNAPLPISAYNDRWWTPDRYMQLRRLGIVWRAVKADAVVGEGMAAYGDVKVDRKDFMTFYYARILDEGATSINYTPRPFWTIMEKRMQSRLRVVGKPGLENMKAELLGQPGLEAPTPT